MGSDLDPETKQAILDDNALSEVSSERIRDEFIKGISSAKDVNHFLHLTKELGLFRQVFPGLDIKVMPASTSDPIAQIAAILSYNSKDAVTTVLKNMKYSSNEQKAVRFLLGLGTISKESAPSLKKDYNRFDIQLATIEEYSRVMGAPSKSIIQAFLKFADAPPAVNPKDLMAQGLKGPDIGKAMNDAEIEAYGNLVGEVRMLVRGILEAGQ
jgi:tRNA nucleotidyltransferase/poly(A) polymerase